MFCLPVSSQKIHCNASIIISFFTLSKKEKKKKKKERNRKKLETHELKETYINSYNKRQHKIPLDDNLIVS